MEDSSPIPNQNPNSITSNTTHANLIISSLLSYPDSSPLSIGSSFDRVLDKSLASASSDVSEQDRLVDRTLELASLLLDSTKRCFRKRASVHNSNSWFLPPELTIKVFSMLDTKSLMQASASCTMFNKCAMDRVCYSHIDLTTAAKETDNGVVCTMIHRAGKELRSLKVGRVIRPAGSDSTASVLTGACLSPLSYNHGFIGSRLRSLRLYNLRPMNCKSLWDVLSVCSSVTELRIVGLYIQSEQLFKTLAARCRLIEYLFLETYGCQSTLDTKTGTALVEFVTNCPNLVSLTLIRFGLNMQTLRNLAENSRKLKYLNISRSPSLKNRFLRVFGASCKDGPLKTLILRNCLLNEKEVLDFFNSLLTGDFKSIQHIDVSFNRPPGVQRSYTRNFPLEKLKEERPGVKFVAVDSVTSSEKGSCDHDEEELRQIEMMETKDDGEDDDYSEDEDSEDEDGVEEEDSDEEIYADHFLL